MGLLHKELQHIRD